MVTQSPTTAAFWNGRRVFVTGHTGFKGSWLCLWLQSMGAAVHGYSLRSPTDPNLFEVARVKGVLASHTLADIRDYDAIARAIGDARPEIVFHLAAQPLVRKSYQRPVETYAINVMGTVHVLEAVRSTEGIKTVVNVTTDKCYENREWPWAYRENEPIGGHDPYSSSKGCAELITAAYRRSFLGDAGVGVATARAGNVVGGGDWAVDRLVPDALRALDAGTALTVRSSEAIRPWQHVLEPVSGYLALAEHLYAAGESFSEAWNFGPAEEDARTVGSIVEYIASRHPTLSLVSGPSSQLHEANYLKLDSSKAHTRLDWRARWSLETALDKTLDWHVAWRGGRDMYELTMQQIDEYATGRVQAGCGAV